MIEAFVIQKKKKNGETQTLILATTLTLLFK